MKTQWRMSVEIDESYLSTLRNTIGATSWSAVTRKARDEKSEGKDKKLETSVSGSSVSNVQSNSVSRKTPRISLPVTDNSKKDQLIQDEDDQNESDLGENDPTSDEDEKPSISGVTSLKEVKKEDENEDENKFVEDLNLDENQDDILPETVAGPSCIRRLSECTVDEPFADSGSDYLPSDSSSASPTHDSENHRVPSPVVYDIEGTARRERKRRLVAKPELWKKNKMKLLRVAGKEYVNRKGAIVTAKSPGIVNCNNCRYKCSINIPRDRQIIICKEYWEMADSTKQKIFICSLVEEKNIDRERNRNDRKKTRKHSRYYHLLSASNKRVRVCQKYFCATFAFSFQVVETALKYRGDSGVYVGFDHRKERPAPNVTSAEQVRHIKTHIDMFPRMASHYCRRDTKRQYLASDLNISVIYCLYCSNYCLQNNVPSVKYNVFRSVFNSYDPPLSFYKPKKDQCVTCNVYTSATDKTELQSQWEAHKAKEKSGMEMKAADKQKAVDNKGETFRAITFDLQSILNVPYAGDSQIFYRRKLSELASKIMVNTTCDTDGNQVKWLQIKWLRFIKTNPSTIFFKYDVKSNDFLKLNIRDVGTKRTRTRKQYENVYDVSLEQQYTSLLPISNAKKHDLLCLLREKVIPGDYKNFVEMLPTAVEAIDIVPSESDYETD
ncbi:unnamed protein product [Psylliodes chrysocephalus]|uniref:Uncharacterized protein n=1 Tax=Psylliodes chrysocephalus TaxID=3402493 RepID=A0A9P0CWF7_9CUCU|nr:unnamed protein product [Psylliodes chrysocephala]